MDRPPEEPEPGDPNPEEPEPVQPSPPDEPAPSPDEPTPSPDREGPDQPTESFETAVPDQPTSPYGPASPDAPASTYGPGPGEPGEAATAEPAAPYAPPPGVPGSAPAAPVPAPKDGRPSSGAGVATGCGLQVLAFILFFVSGGLMIGFLGSLWPFVLVTIGSALLMLSKRWRRFATGALIVSAATWIVVIGPCIALLSGSF